MERIVFMGTPEFAVPSLRALAERYEVTLVVTQPDRPAGRSRALRAPAVKAAAQALGLPVYQPESLRGPEALARLQQVAPTAIVVAAYGEILRRNVLALPPRGCVNVHASLLPRHRGAGPIAAAILAGDAVAGVTIMLMDEGMDTGAMLAQAEVPIDPDDTTGTLTARLAELGAQLLAETLPRWLAGEIEPQPQDGAQATYAARITKQDGLIDWAEPAEIIVRQVRAFDPWPGAYSYWQGRRLRVTRAEAVLAWCGREVPGTVLEMAAGPAVATGEGALLLHEIQLEGKCCVGCTEFLRGQRGFIGAVLGDGATLSAD
ncbi:MAG TPA: methionyl-tRNA formyltransferase [Anaerolineae bacterium]|nr:methionyl-tRNA formyltransferase [Anaerolineae bacterium]HPL28607.1 methionyl-tRNA formyltransferase [Anaerolineae bacterium]